jgi:hypothetical protein
MIQKNYQKKMIWNGEWEIAPGVIRFFVCFMFGGIYRVHKKKSDSELKRVERQHSGKDTNPIIITTENLNILGNERKQ